MHSGATFTFEDAEDHGVPPAVADERRVAETSLIRHTDLGQHPGGAEIPRVTGRMDPVKPQLAEPVREKLSPDLCADALPPYPRMHDVRDLTLALITAADMQLTHAHHVLPDASDMGEPALRVSDQALTADPTKARVWSSMFGPQAW